MKRKHAVIAGIAALLIGGVTIWFWPKKEEGLKVPLGVEQAAIITYSGPTLAVAPYKWGVAVNVRIASVVEQSDRRVYDVRYIVNRAGSFDLRDFLVAENGAKLDALPEFRFVGDAQLSKDLDARVQETEELRVDVGGHYFEWLIVLGVLWIVWLLLLIFWKRKIPAAHDDGIKEPTPAEMLRALLAKLESGQIDTAQKAQLEMLLLRRWREDLSLHDLSMTEALDKIGQHERTSAPMRKLQHWLHHPASPVPREEISALLMPFGGDAAGLQRHSVALCL